MDDRRRKEESLSWFLNFIQTDLNALRPAYKNLIDTELTELYWTLVPEEERSATIKAVSVEDVLKDDYEPKIKRSVLADIRVDAQEIQSALKHFFEKFLKGEATSVDLPMVKKTAVVNDDRTFAIQYEGKRAIKGGRLSKRSSAQSDFEIVPPKDIFVDYVFTFVLAGLPQGVIKKCKECQKLFAHFSAKTKFYCSNYCAWKDLSRKRREELKEHPRKYKAFLKKQREAMRLKYEEKRVAKLLLRASPRPKTQVEKLTEEKMELAAREDGRP